jgi:hypothetical protein
MSEVGFELIGCPVFTSNVNEVIKHGADEAADGGIIWRDANNLDAPLDFTVEPFDWYDALQFGAMRLRETHIGQHVGFQVIHHGRQIRGFWAQLVGGLAPLPAFLLAASSWAKAVSMRTATTPRPWQPT